MPISPPRPCRQPGCAALVRDGSGYCLAHKPKRAPHGSAGQRKTGRAGVRDRERIKARDNGLCQDCLERGHVTLGTQVDHVVPLSAGGADTDDNKRLLCDQCHLEKTRNERSDRR